MIPCLYSVGRRKLPWVNTRGDGVFPTRSVASGRQGYPSHAPSSVFSRQLRRVMTARFPQRGNRFRLFGRLGMLVVRPSVAGGYSSSGTAGGLSPRRVWLWQMVERDSVGCCVGATPCVLEMLRPSCVTHVSPSQTRSVAMSSNVLLSHGMTCTCVSW